MTKDPILSEIRKFRDNYAKKHGYSIPAICEDLRKFQAAQQNKLKKTVAKSGRKIGQG